ELGAHHQVLPIRLPLGCGHIDLGAGMLLHTALANVGYDSNDARVAIADTLGQAPHRVLARPVAAGGGLVDDNHVLAGVGVLPAKIAALTEVHAHGAEIAGSDDVDESIVVYSRRINPSLGAEVPTPIAVERKLV